MLTYKIGGSGATCAAGVIYIARYSWMVVEGGLTGRAPPAVWTCDGSGMLNATQCAMGAKQRAYVAAWYALTMCCEENHEPGGLLWQNNWSRLLCGGVLARSRPCLSASTFSGRTPERFPYSL